MTTATAQRTWTEAEIREAIEELMPGIDFDVPDEFRDALAPIGDSDMARARIGWDPDYTPRDGHPGTLWADLRPSEADELQAALHDVYRAAGHYYVETVREGAIRAALAFAEAHPDVPLGHWRPPAERGAPATPELGA